jgi:osmoprotectant transport system ATP-binding protein
LVILDNVSKSYGRHAAVAPTTLEFERGKTTVLIGPSGCGKSTLLRMIVGLVAPDTGSVLVDGRGVGGPGLDQARHGIGYVIQDGGLFPHLTARANVVLLARHLGWPPDRLAARTAELSRLVQLPQELLGRYPGELSGGQRQRIGLMRALMLDPPLLLLDEPLGALDPITRFELQDELKAIFHSLHKTVVIVTHDMGEAAHFGDIIVLLRAGRVVQRGALGDLLHRPADQYVTQFIRAQRGAFPAFPA